MADTEKPGRFRSHTQTIDLRRLEHETNRVLALGLVVSVAIHAALFGLVRFDRTAVRVRRPIQMELIIRPPRMTRPLVIPRQEFVRREFRRQFVQRMPGGQFIFKSLPDPKDVIELARDQLIPLTPEEIRTLVQDVIADINGNYRAGLLDSLDAELYIDELAVYLDAIEREAADMLSLKESLLTIDDLDTGQYRAVVIKDPEDRQNLTGFIYLPASVWGVDLGADTSQNTLVPPQTGRRAVIGLAEGFTKYTGVSVKVDEQLHLDKPKLLDYPAVYISAERVFALTSLERKNLRTYLEGGGFALLEPYSVPGLQSLKQMIAETFEGQARILTIPDDHPVLHCFYEFENPKIQIDGESLTMPDTNFMLDGIFLGDRLIGLLLSGDYGVAWAANQYENPYFRVGVNAIVYALIRQGSAAKQYISAD